ncbi:MAG: AMP-binding protein [Novosphingobium sp.]
MTGLTTGSLWQRLQSGKAADFLVLPGRTVSYADCAGEVRRWVQQFDNLGLREGDRVLIRTASESAAVSCFVAALLDGLVPVMLTPDTPDISAAAVLGTVEAACLVADEGAWQLPLPAATCHVSLSEVVRTGRSWLGKRAKADFLGGVSEQPASRSPRLPASDAGLAYILFTSGTTSSPSGVMLTRANVFANLATLSRLFGYDQQSRIFNDMILAHADGFIQGPLLALANGCAVIRSGGFRLPELEQWLNRVRQQRATHVITVPTIWAMIDSYAAHDDYFDAPECRALLSVAARLPDPLWQKIESRFKRPVFNQYGLTETVASALYAGPAPEMGAFGTIGRPVDCEARIDPLSATPGEGELHLRGDNIFAGYWANETRTRASFTDDGWMKTGDLARLRPDGSYAMLGRMKSVIMMGGFLIRPDEIDEAMQAHPSVRESVTLGIADDLFEEVPVTAVVCDPPLDEVALTEHARTRLSGQKVPKRIVALDAIPRGISGKPNLSALRDILTMELGAQHSVGGDDEDLLGTVLAIAADVFRVSPALLSPQSATGDVPGWDSFSQLNFILAVERHFDVEIPVARMASMKSIADVVRAVGDLIA